MREGDVLALIDRIYDAALDDGSWPFALEQLSLAFNGVGTSVLSMRRVPPLLAVSPSLTEALDQYSRYWWRNDAFLNYAKKHGLGPGIHIDSDVFDEEYKRKNDYYQEFMRHQDIGGIVSVVVQPFEEATMSINVQRRLGVEPASAEERRRFALVARHLSRASAMSLRLHTAESVGRSFASRLSDFDCAVVVVGRDGRMLVSNAAFDALRSAGIEVRRGRLCLARADMQPALQRLIRCALDGTLGDAGPDTLAVPRPDSLLPLLLRAVPVTPERAERHIGAIPSRAVMLMVLNPEHSAYPKLTTALQALGLTLAQARVALAIGSGQSPREAAEALHISEATVRTTLKHLYSRLGIDRQSQLARLVSRAVPFSS